MFCSVHGVSVLRDRRDSQEASGEVVLNGTQKETPQQRQRQRQRQLTIFRHRHQQPNGYFTQRTIDISMTANNPVLSPNFLDLKSPSSPATSSRGNENPRLNTTLGIQRHIPESSTAVYPPCCPGFRVRLIWWLTIPMHRHASPCIPRHPQTIPARHSHSVLPISCS